MDKNTLRTLYRRFPEQFIEERQGMSYVTGHAVINRLNESFEGSWSFEITEQTILETEVIVRGRLTAGGEVKEQFGSQPIKRYNENHAKSGAGDQYGGRSEGRRYRLPEECATLYGVALHLYGRVESLGQT